MSRLLSRATMAIFVVLAVASSASAQMRFETQHGIKGKQKPGFKIYTDVQINLLTIALTDQNGKAINLKATNIAPGKPELLTFKQKEPMMDYHVEWDVEFADGSRNRFANGFTFTNVEPIEVKVGGNDVDLEARKLTWTLNNPAKLAELVILGTDGKELARLRKEFTIHPPATPYTFTWDPVEGEIARLDLKVTDVAGFWTTYRITPFHIEVPHEEVVFELGKSRIRKSQEPKLVETMKRIAEELKKYQSLGDLKLFVGGCTDTVASKKHNRKLSQRRAKAIAKWFRKHKLKIPIFYFGFGEEALAVATPDEVEEERNRRAIYYLASGPPTPKGFTDELKWKELK